MSDATVHIDAWEAAGVIDRETADRLRAAAPVPEIEPTTGPTTRSAAAELFGPSVTIAEVFGYLGGGFLLGAWSFFLGRSSGDVGVSSGLLALAAAGAIAGLGLVLRRRGARESRAAGVAFFVATAYVAVGTVAAGLDERVERQSSRWRSPPRRPSRPPPSSAGSTRPC